MKKVTLLGVGAVGGALLCKNPDMLAKIHVAVDGERKVRMQKDGIVVNGVSYFPQVAKQEPQDILLIAVKNTQLKDVLPQISKYVGQNTVLVPLMNGISAVEVLEEAFPNQVVVPAVVYVDAQKTGNQIRASEKYLVQIGGVDIEVLQAVQSVILDCGAECEIREDIQRCQWKKFMTNVGANQVSALTGANYADMTRIPEILEVVAAAMQEVLAVAIAMGVDLKEEDVKQAIAVFQRWSGNGKSSMLQDVEAQRITEVEVFAGKVVALGKTYHVATPINQTLYWLLSAKQKVYTKQS